MTSIARVLALGMTLETIEKVDGKEKAEEYLKEIRETDKGLYDEYMICEGYEKFGEDIWRWFSEEGSSD